MTTPSALRIDRRQRPARGPRQWQPVAAYTLSDWQRERVATIAGKPLPPWHEPRPTTSRLRQRLIQRRRQEAQP